MKNTWILCMSLLVLVSCKPEIEPEEYGMGDVDATRFVAIGTAGTAGYADDALYADVQQNSFVSIMAEQFNSVAAISFDVPLVSVNSVGVSFNGDSKLELGYKTDCNNETSLSPIRSAASGDGSILSFSVFNALNAFENLGVPGMSALEVDLAGYTNPFYARIASDPASSSLLQDAVAQNPTFFSMQLGDEDILRYALSGGVGNPIPPSSGAAGVGFDGSLNNAISALTANGANGVIGTIPNPLSAPYFTTIPYNGLTLDAANAATMNSVFNPLGMTFVVGDNGFTVSDPTEPFGVRKMVDGELILLSIPLDSVKCYGMGSIVPIPEQYVLSLDEIEIIKEAVTSYNAIIAASAQLYNLALADVHGLYANLEAGIVYNGVSMSTSFVTGGYFSLDGRNLNPIGQAMVANRYIEAINEHYNSKIPWADVTKYRGVIFP